MVMASLINGYEYPQKFFVNVSGVIGKTVHSVLKNPPKPDKPHNDAIFFVHAFVHACTPKLSVHKTFLRRERSSTHVSTYLQGMLT